MPIDMSGAVKAPPRKAATPRAKAQPPPQVMTQSPREAREEGLNGLGQLFQGGLVLFGQYADAGATGRHAPNIARETAALADRYEAVAKGVDLIIQAGPFTGLLLAVLPLALQIGANHKRVDASNLGALGVVPPEVLEAQMKAEVLRMQADSMRMQQEALQNMQAAQAEYDAAMGHDGSPISG